MVLFKCILITLIKSSEFCLTTEKNVKENFLNVKSKLMLYKLTITLTISWPC